MQSATPFRPSLVDSPSDQAEAESLAKSLDLRYRNRAFQAHSSTQLDVGGLGPRFVQRLAFEQIAAHQVMFCWAAKVSISRFLSVPVS